MKIFSWRRTRAIFFKEFKHIWRDPFTLMMALMLPLAIVLILGSSIEFNIKSIDMAYFDGDKTSASRKLVETFGSSNYFKPYDIVNPNDIHNDIVAGRARVGMVVPPGFEKDMMVDGALVQVLVDGTESSTMSSVSNYLNTINQNAYFKIWDVPMDMAQQTPQYKVRYLFNPELNSRWFAVPGLSAVIIALVAIMLTTLTICREWERGLWKCCCQRRQRVWTLLWARSHRMQCLVLLDSCWCLLWRRSFWCAVCWWLLAVNIRNMVVYIGVFGDWVVDICVH